MNIREFAPDFTVFVFSQDADLGSRVKYTVAELKYENYFFSDVEEMQRRIELSPPHVIIFDQAGLVGSLSEVFQNALKISSEIKFICLAEIEVLPELLSYKSYNLVQLFDRTNPVISEQVGLVVDQTCETLYRLYQNEQVFNLYRNEQNQLQSLQRETDSQKKGPEARPFQTRIAEYRSADSKEDLLQKFFKQTPNQSWAFLKFVKSINSYILVSSQQMPDEWVQGLSYKIPNSEKDFNDRMMIGEFSEGFLNYIKRKWSVDIVKVLPLVIKNEIEGLLITPQDISAEVAEDFSLVSLVYNIILSETQPKQFDVEDALTGMFNENFYKRILEKETDRSKRTFAPVSVVKVAIDSYKELEISQGRVFCDEIIKKVAEVIKKTSRLPDYTCRTAENEFSLILTNCNRKGAALRAERLRQTLKTESFSEAGILVTVSQGISEYPSLTKSADNLDESARKTLDFIVTKGGDKICIYKAPVDHKPDFQVNT
ncbi:MAG: GGDEF domain-containing protein [Pseudobdellovibrio sp.]